MFNYLKVADLHRDLAAAYDKIDSFSKQVELQTSLQQEVQETLKERLEVYQSINESLKNTIKEKDDIINKLEKEIEDLSKDYDQREGQFPIEY
jgi:predicted  nucleic acid-binding Zn-ribbon protein